MDAAGWFFIAATGFYSAWWFVATRRAESWRRHRVNRQRHHDR